MERWFPFESHQKESSDQQRRVVEMLLVWLPDPSIDSMAAAASQRGWMLAVWEMAKDLGSQ